MARPWQRSRLLVYTVAGAQSRPSCARRIAHKTLMLQANHTVHAHVTKNNDGSQARVYHPINASVVAALRGPARNTSILNKRLEPYLPFWPFWPGRRLPNCTKYLAGVRFKQWR